MNGEIGLKIKKVSCSNDLIRPLSEYRDNPAIDLAIQTTDDGFFHICGDNDWGYLALEAIKPILKEGIQLELKILEDVQKYKPEVIVLGKNDFRIFDILHTARDGEYGIKMFRGVPVVKGKFLDGIKYYGKNNEIEFPITKTVLPF